ncbi:MAG: cytochrome C oxidase subunit IV family protein [Caldilineaceae bacterium]|nr:cytochrome C oxidase subunit IV family protein [Caldilineaceae bacterium]
MSERKKPVAKAQTSVYRTGYVVAIILAVVTIVEFYIATHFNNFAIMMLLGLLKAYFVVNYFMHVKSLWSEEESH